VILFLKIFEVPCVCLLTLVYSSKSPQADAHTHIPRATHACRCGGPPPSRLILQRGLHPILHNPVIGTGTRVARDLGCLVLLVPKGAKLVGPPPVAYTWGTRLSPHYLGIATRLVPSRASVVLNPTDFTELPQLKNFTRTPT